MEIATKIAPLGLALIMLGLGFGLTIQDFLRVFQIPKDFSFSSNFISISLPFSIGPNGIDL